MTPAQLTALRVACFADPTATAFFAAPGNAAGLRAYLNAASGSTPADIPLTTSGNTITITPNASGVLTIT